MIWLIGCKGMLGTEIGLVLDRENISYVGTDAETDITDSKALEEFASGKDLTAIINCSAYTAVDKAESEEELALKINGTGAGNLASLAEKLNVVLIHFSTDYVFGGKSNVPYSENDPTEPGTAYGRTKLAGEIEITSKCSKFFIFRISWLYGMYGNNFVATMLRLMSEKESLNIVSDQIGAPTYAGVLAKNIIKLLKHDDGQYGIYHYSDEGVISWYDFACKIYEYGRDCGLIERDVEISAITTDMYPTPAKRPAWSVFDKTKVRELRFVINKWEENLSEYIKLLRQS